MQAALRQAARTTARPVQRRLMSSADKATLDALGKVNGQHFMRETAIALGLGFACAVVWKVSVADPVRASIDAYYAEYERRGL